MKNNIRFKIDEKSLFLGTYNDYDRGQTATVATPLNQSKDERKWRKDILELKNYNCNVDNPPEMLIRKCQLSSHSGNTIDNVFVFSNLLLDGEKLNTCSQFAMYFKRETDEFITKTDGTRARNTHLGRIKLHYPITFSFKSDGYNIDNRDVLKSIIKQNGGFAFIVRGFEYFQDSKTLNFITSVIGPNGVRLSTVFRRKKGVGKKLMIDPNKVADNNYLAILEQDISVSEITDASSYELINKTKSENGKLGEEFIFNLLKEKLASDSELYHTSLDFPQSPYDIEYMENGKKRYVEVKSTAGTKIIFNMSSGEFKFMEKYKDSYKLYVVTEVREKFPNYKEYTYYDIVKMRKEYTNIRFYQ